MRKSASLFLFLLSFVFIQNASAFCDGFETKISVSTNIGTVKYITTRSKRDFIRSSPTPVSPNTLGLTVSRVGMTGGYTANIETEDGKTCVSLKTVDLKLANDELTVYIDKKYKPSSCEYKVIKNHEKHHVAVAQQALIFFKPDIEAQVQKTILNLRPQIVGSAKERDEVLSNQFQQIINDLQPLLEHINKKTAEKNYQIDTPESYARTKELCKNW